MRYLNHRAEQLVKEYVGYEPMEDIAHRAYEDSLTLRWRKVYWCDLQLAKLTNSLRAKNDVRFRVGLRPWLLRPSAPEAESLGVTMKALGADKSNACGGIGLDRLRAAVNDVERIGRPGNNCSVHG